MSEELVTLFNDLDEYRDFCRTYGRVFNEAHLYNKVYRKKKTPYEDFMKWKETGKARYWPGYQPDFKPSFYKAEKQNRNNQKGE